LFYFGNAKLSEDKTCNAELKACSVSAGPDPPRPKGCGDAAALLRSPDQPGRGPPPASSRYRRLSATRSRSPAARRRGLRARACAALMWVARSGRVQRGACFLEHRLVPSSGKDRIGLGYARGRGVSFFAGSFLGSHSPCCGLGACSTTRTLRLLCNGNVNTLWKAR